MKNSAGWGWRVLGTCVVCLPIVGTTNVAGANEPDDNDKPAAKTSGDSLSPSTLQGINKTLQQHAALAPREIFSRTIHSTVWIRTDKGSGSGWVIDKDRKLIVTNSHVIHDCKQIVVHFPEYNDKKLVTQREHYVKNSPQFAAKIFLEDRQRDLAVLKLNSMPGEATAVKLAAESTAPGEMVFSVGNPGATESLWIFSSGSVRQLTRSKYSLQNGQMVEANIVETQSPVNPGDSGGPVVNERGELVAVVSSGASNANLVTQCIDLSEVQTIQKEIDAFWDPKTAEQFYRRGLNAQKRADWEAAMTDFNAALKLDRKHALSMAERGRCFFEQGDMDTARADFDEAIKIDPDCLTARIGHLSISLRQDRYDDAIADATAIVRIDPKHAQAYSLRSVARFYKKEFDAGLKDIGRAIDIEPTSQRYAMKAENELALKNFDAALQSFAKSVDMDPYNETAIKEMTSTLNDLGRSQDAIRVMTAVLNQNARNPYALTARARTHLAMKVPVEAINDLNSAVALQPRAELFALRGKAYMDLREKDKSLADYRQLVKLMPKSDLAFKDLAEAAWYFSEFQEASNAATQSINLNPKVAGIYITRAMANLALGRSSGTIDTDVDRARNLDSKTYGRADVRVRNTRHLVFVNETDDNVELQFYFRAPAVDEKLYWYPGEPADSKPYTWKLKPHSENRIQFRDASFAEDKFVDAMEFIYVARSLDSNAVWEHKTPPIRIAPDNGYISYRTEEFRYHLYPAKK